MIKLRRYNAYIKGWGQAFSEFEAVHESSGQASWLIASDQFGIILPNADKPEGNQKFFCELDKTGKIILSDKIMRVGSFKYDLSSTTDQKGLQIMLDFIEDNEDIYLFLSYHLMFPKGVKIITFSINKPFNIIYKEGDLISLDFQQ